MEAYHKSILSRQNYAPVVSPAVTAISQTRNAVQAICQAVGYFYVTCSSWLQINASPLD